MSGESWFRTLFFVALIVHAFWWLHKLENTKFPEDDDDAS